MTQPPIVIPPAPNPPTPRSVSYIDSTEFSIYAQRWVDRDAAQTALIEQLTPVPPVPRIRWGIDAITKAQHDNAVPIYGPVDAWRYYLQPGETMHYPTEYTIGPTETFVESSKIMPASLTVAQLTTFFQSVPSDRPFYYCPWHEPEDDIIAGKFTSADYKGMFTKARQAQQQVGSHIRIPCILMGYTWIPGSKRNPEDYIPANADFDMLTSDTYFAGTIGQSVTTIPTAFDAQIATAAAHGKPWGVTETGVGQKVTGQARLDAIKLLSQTIKSKLLSQPVSADEFLALYFSTSEAGEWSLHNTDGSAAAWKAGQAS